MKVYEYRQTIVLETEWVEMMNRHGAEGWTISHMREFEALPTGIGWYVYLCRETTLSPARLPGETTNG